MTITSDKNGGRVINLFLPFQDGSGETIEVVSLSAVTWGHVLRWQKGDYKTGRDLLVELAGIPEETLRLLRYPDVDRVVMAFIEYIPQEIRTSIQNGYIPFDAFPEPIPEEPMADDDVYLERPEEPSSLQQTATSQEAPASSYVDPEYVDPGFDLNDEPRHG